MSPFFEAVGVLALVVAFGYSLVPLVMLLMWVVTRISR